MCLSLCAHFDEFLELAVRYLRGGKAQLRPVNEMKKKRKIANE